MATGGNFHMAAGGVSPSCQAAATCIPIPTHRISNDQSYSDYRRQLRLGLRSAALGLHTRGESRIDQEQVGEVSHLRGLLLREYLVFLVGGRPSV